MSIMDALDRAYVAGQSAAKSIGFIPRSAAGIREVRDGAATFVEFAALLEDGWPGFRLQLPEGAEFRQAVRGMFLRSGLWRTPQSLEATTALFVATLTRAKAPFGARHRERVHILITGHFGGEVRIRIERTSRDHTLVTIAQRRQQAASAGAARRVMRTAPQPSHVS
jgi:hypothetical protein